MKAFPLAVGEALKRFSTIRIFRHSQQRQRRVASQGRRQSCHPVVRDTVVVEAQLRQPAVSAESVRRRVRAGIGNVVAPERERAYRAAGLEQRGAQSGAAGVADGAAGEVEALEGAAVADGFGEPGGAVRADWVVAQVEGGKHGVVEQRLGQRRRAEPAHPVPPQVH